MVLVSDYFHFPISESEVNLVSVEPYCPTQSPWLHTSPQYRYGAAGCAVGDVLWLLGGVHLNSTSELLMINPLQRSWVGYTVEVGC